MKHITRLIMTSASAVLIGMRNAMERLPDVTDQ
jgi:hypothetical protein